MNTAARRRRARVRQAVEIVLENPREDLTASLGVHDAVTLSSHELRSAASGLVLARLHRDTRRWQLDLRRAEALGVPVGPWERVSVRSVTGNRLVRIEPDS